MTGRVVYTVGHGARTVGAFVAILQEARVTVVVDVRRHPGSRRHPQFGREPLALALRDTGIGYEWQGEALGGHRSPRSGIRHTAMTPGPLAGYADHMDTRQFRDSVDTLVGAEQSAVMCAETQWWHCHRMLVADALTMRGATVVHLLDGKREPHRLHATVRRGDDGWPVYDVPDTLPGI